LGDLRPSARGECGALKVLAEREELGSNLLHADERGVKQCTVKRPRWLREPAPSALVTAKTAHRHSAALMIPLAATRGLVGFPDSAKIPSISTARIGQKAIKAFWGDQIGEGNANCSGCGSQWDGRQTSPVGSFKPNAFGLYDMAGNVWQWVQNCYHADYNEAPADGSVRIIGDCRHRVVRGGSWGTAPQYIRSASRDWFSADDRDFHIGFRLGRTLAP